MPEGEAWLALQYFAEQNERVTLFRDYTTSVWTLEWFNIKGGYNFKENISLIDLVEEVCT